jgi:hypothetical protein
MVISSGRGQQELLPQIYKAKPVPKGVGVVNTLILLMNLDLIFAHVLLLSNIPTLFGAFCPVSASWWVTNPSDTPP